jgi:hypothetical protein
MKAGERSFVITIRLLLLLVALAKLLTSDLGEYSSITHVGY